MIELPPEATALLDKARRDHNPSDADAERVRRALHAKLGIAAALAPSAAAAALSAQASASAGTQLGAGSASLAGGLSTGGISAAAGAGMGKTGTLLFGLKASKVILAVVTLSGVASVPLMMRSDVRPRTEAAQCTSEPCPPGQGEVSARTEPALDPSVTPTPVAQTLAERRSAERRARRHERRQRALQSERAHGERARDVRGSRDDDDDAPTAGDRAQVAHDATIASRATTVSGATETVNGPASVASGTSATSVRAASARASDAADPDTDPEVAAEADAPSAPPELALIRGALTSLRDGAPQRALALLGEHGEVYPEGAFASERRGLRIVALCASGRLDEGRKERVVFLRREGSAPVAERVRHACQEAPGK